ncbi:MAG TPA: ABC transporter permease [Croceibacterium sp.]|nr:ABC transporter permease [Croceibacterium sp.]
MTFRGAFEQTLLTIVTTRDIMAVAILSVLLYAFYYPAPYEHQAAQALPLVVVDGDRSALSRRLIGHLGDTREITLAGEAPDMEAARAAVRNREAEGILLISHGFSGNALTQRPGTGIGLWLNGTYLLRAEGIGLGLAEVVTDALEDVQASRGSEQASIQPVAVQPLFNTTGGYRDYIFPSVANIILQQTLLFAAARLIAERRRRGERPLPLAGALGQWAACTLIGVFAAFFYFGFIYWAQDIPRAGNVAALFISVPLFAMAVAALGLWVGSFFRNGDDALKVLLPTSVPLVFLAGFAWPLDAMPGWLQGLAWLSPATVAMHLFVRFNQMGATIADAAGPLTMVAVLAAAYGTAFLLRNGNLRKRIATPR